ncbi:MAG TPA: Ig-like domain-containing protein [Prolixibacteraceae bacterium]|nr:Ig-like domain-containing protein [Prolixibacteraceae bacterium]
MPKITLLFLILTVVCTGQLTAQRGYYDAPYIRYEADKAILSNGALATAKSYAQADLQSEASEQVCVDMKSDGAMAEFSFTEAADGLVIRYSVPDGQTAAIGVYDGATKITTLILTSKWSWELLWNNGDPNNTGVTNKNPKFRFDEIRYKLPQKLSALKLIRESGSPSIDFIEMEPVPDVLTAPQGAAVYNGNGSTLQAFIDANGGKTIFIPSGVYNINSQLYFGVSRTKIQGAGMWYTQLNFTVTNESNGGLNANATHISYADLFITTDMTTRTKGYAGIHGIYTQESVIKNIWVEHCGTGAWIAQYSPGGVPYADGFLMTGCRFRNTYADGVNLCKGTRNAIVEHCNFRNNGDDGMAIWCAEGLECINNTFRNNTVENVWRAAGAALYGGKDNKFYDIIIRDNVETGITITNNFPGVGFNDKGMHDFHNITLTGCGTFNGVYNDRLGAINIYNASGAGTKVQNVHFYNIDMVDSKCDAIRIARTSGTGIFNLSFENVTVNGTGKEYPANNINNSTAGRGYVAILENAPSGKATYCGLNYSNLGGNANGTAFYPNLISSFRWTALTGCDYTAVSGISLSPADTTMAGGATLQLRPTFAPVNAANRIVSYVSSDPSVALVDYAGLVTAMGKGQATITVTTQEGNYSASSTINVKSDPVIHYKIKSRWQNTYLYDADDRVRYSVASTGNNYLWLLEDVDGVKAIKNIGTSDYMNIENLTGYVECTAPTAGSKKAEWATEDTGDGYVRIKNQGITAGYIHVENLQNQAQYGAVEPSWWSAMWLLEPVLITTSVNNLSTPKTMGIYPNPTHGDFMLSVGSFARKEKVEILVFNMTGQVMVRQTAIADDNGDMNTKLATGNTLSQGNYYVVVKGESNITNGKLLVVR